MDENALLKKIQQLVRDEVRPVKDLVEITKKKVDSQALYAHSNMDNIRSIREQQSLMNEKLDQHTDSLVTIETTINVYGDMYKLNNDNMKKLEKRIGHLEDNSGVIPNPDSTLASLS